MRSRPASTIAAKRERGSILVIVLWVALGLVAMTLYFADSMVFELRAADNALSGQAADQAIEGAARYVASVLSTFATNGVVPEVTSYHSEAVPVGEARFWLIGRPVDSPTQSDRVYFGLIDEGSKLNLNTATAAMLGMLTNMTLELAANIVDWRSTNGTVSENGDGPAIYSQFQPPYLIKNAPYETIDELRLVYPADLGILVGEDYNRNGVLDPSETDTNRNNAADPGILEHVTVYSREKNVDTNGAARINISTLSATTSSGLMSLLETNLSTARANEIMTRLGLVTSGGGGRPGGGTGGGGAPGGGGGGGGGGAVTTVRFNSPLAFYRRSGMTLEEFVLVGNSLTVTNASTIEGRINVNTAGTAVLSCLPGITPDLAQQLADYRRQNPGQLATVAWVAEALGENGSSALDELQAGDYITTQSFQFSADLAAVGPHGRGYRRVRCVFDMSDGTPRMVYRQDLSHLGWALDKYTRQTWLAAKDTR
jgi:type II secretory pathway component PulK